MLGRSGHTDLAPGPPSSSGASLKIAENEPEPTTLVETYAKIQAELTSSVVEPVHGEVPFVQGHIFSTVICILVMLNTLQMGAEAEYPDLSLWVYTENIFTAAFFLEMVLKLVCLRRAYFKDKGNWLDASLAVMAAIDTWCLALLGDGVDLQSLSILRVLRMARLVRILRLVKSFKRFVLIIAGVVDAIRTTCWVACVLGLAIYVSAIFCVGYLGKSTQDLYPGYTEEPVVMDDFEFMQNYNPYASFGSMGRSMLTLLNIAILAEWTEVIRPIYEKQPGMVLFFIFFVQFVTFGVMNVIIGMIVDNVMSNAHNMHVLNERKEVERRIGIFEQISALSRTEMDKDHNGSISREELARNMQTGTLKTLLNQVNLPQGCSAQELYYLLDQRGEGEMRSEEFVQAFYRLMQNDDFQSKIMFQMGLHHCKFLVKELQRETKEQHEAMHAMCQAQFHDLRRLVLDMKRQDSEREGLRPPVERKLQMPDELQRCPPKGQPQSAGEGTSSTSAEVDGKAEEGDSGASRSQSLFMPFRNNHSSSVLQLAPIRPAMLQEVLDDLPVFDGLSDVRSVGGASSADPFTRNDLRRDSAASPSGAGHPGLGPRIDRAVEVARLLRAPADMAPSTGADRHEGYRELAGCLDAVCAEVQEAVRDSVRLTFAEWLLSVEMAKDQERTSCSASPTARAQAAASRPVTEASRQ